MSTEDEPVESDSSMVESTATSITSIPLGAEVIRVRLSFDDLYRRDFHQVLGLAYVLTGSRSIAEELTQEAFMAAYKRWQVIGNYDLPGAWVRRVVCNRAASSVRKRIREAKALLRLSKTSDVSFATGLTGPAGQSDHEFWEAIRMLPSRQVQAVALYYLEDLSVSEIGEILGCSEGTVKTHLSRARKTIANDLQEEDAR